MGDMPNVTPKGEKPLPKAAPMRLVAQENDKHQERVLVPLMPYGEESGYSLNKEELKWMRSNPMNSQE